MYWPARNCRRSAAGRRSRMRITSGANQLQCLHAAGQRFYRNVLDSADFTAFDDQVGTGAGLTEQRHAQIPLGGRQRGFLRVAVVDGTFDHFALA